MPDETIEEIVTNFEILEDVIDTVGLEINERHTWPVVLAVHLECIAVKMKAFSVHSRQRLRSRGVEIAVCDPDIRGVKPAQCRSADSNHLRVRTEETAPLHDNIVRVAQTHQACATVK